MKKILLGAAFAMALSQVNAAPDPNFHIYLCIGQSNMAGRGTIREEDKVRYGDNILLFNAENKDLLCHIRSFHQPNKRLYNSAILHY